MNEDCSQLSCAIPANAVQEYLQQYSLDQIVVSNAAYTTVINGIPVTIPAGTFNYYITGVGIFSPVTFQGCQSLISYQVPSDTTVAQFQAIVQQMLNQAAQQQAQCNAVSSGVIQPTKYGNNQITIESSCTDEAPLSISTSLPSGITQSGNSLVLAGGVFSSVISQDDADQKGVDFITSFLADLFASGHAICGAGCTVDHEPSPDINGYWVQPIIPTRLRVKNWDSLKGLFALNGCPGCGAGAVHPEWDGTLVPDIAIKKFKPSQGLVSVCDTDTNNSHIFLELDGWELIISDAGNVHTFGYWIKSDGSQPVGIYSINNGCAFDIPELQTIEIECY